ncbi:ewing's tumor-associated antigen 1-like [Cheilinus undulatus]|uniref:ewing's tumor-associated antigen 1-like n=1 Tax=Cheilinus undulatus TaxID=241271 RepID=UPI001BD6BA40|nr:ewing's tumor-associated antigen 1-like [Cheilinus undulatus]
MNVVGMFDPPCGLTGSSPAATPRRSRLSRSSRQTQQTPTATENEPLWSEQPEFKTPTRILRSRTGGGFSEESPHNDSDFQQDIIWDATSPSPNRLGKRGKKKPPGAVNISEIVSRIAPKHGRPKVAEPTLQQWIGDSAAIPCTPDIPAPKPKKKSPRPNGVDDLLKLAQQFDFNMFRRDEEEVEDLHQQSLELLSEDVLDFENDFSASLPGNPQPAVNAAAGRESQNDPDLQMEDDLDFLFDAPTQHVSRNLSQASQVKQTPSTCAKEASGKASASSLTSSVSTVKTKVAPLKDDFEDDWENDDLLNDSLVLEMTQNPQMFSAPAHCSTQKPPSEIKHHSPASVPISGGIQTSGNVRQRSTFKLESNPRFTFKKSQADTLTNSKVDYSSKPAEEDSQRSRSGVLAGAGSQESWQKSNSVKSDLQKPQRTPDPNVNHSTAASSSAESAPLRPAAASSHSEAAAVFDFLDDDLNSFFSSDPVWDDLADDDLLCEMCEDVENQIQSAKNVSTKHNPSMSTQKAPLQPSTRTWDNRTQQPTNHKPFPPKQTPQTFPGAPGSSYSGGFVSNVAAGAQMKTDSFRYTQTKTSSGSVNSSVSLQGSSRIQSAPHGSIRKEQFTFKKPSNPVSTVTNNASGKCSAAEIELKKQQAMERRRQRLQATQNLRAPT